MMMLALARRYRPKTFAAVVGQEVTLRALCNALEIKRIHHAYLFTGTRGVGKTTLARILAKCLNCEVGISNIPCEQCTACREIDAGCFVDLLEVDAASRTKVEDIRELLENVQYLPTRGRFKIYLIDEVHMLSGHSFNALLKTLEEPPAHVKFLLATTDPQKLPITVLSRCLQFHLKRLPFNQIVDYLATIAKNEKATFETEALQELSRAAEGSLRDALSLLDQALAYGNGQIETETVRTMLGFTNPERLINLLSAVAEGNAKQLLAESELLADSVPDFSQLLTQLLGLIHQIALAQSVPEVLDESVQEREAILTLAKLISREEIQLYYQIGLHGQRDLSYAPTPQMGFEMTLLRMVAFQPAKTLTRHYVPPSPASGRGEVEETPAISAGRGKIEETPVASATIPLPLAGEGAAQQRVRDDWNIIVPHLKMTGLAKAMAEQCTVATWGEDFISLTLDESQKPLWNKRHEERLSEALCEYLGNNIRLKITFLKTEMKNVTVVSEANDRSRDLPPHQTVNQEAINRIVKADPQIQKLMQTFDAKIEQVTVEND